MRSHGLSRESSPYLEWDCEGTGSKLLRVPRALRFGLQLVVDQMLQTLKSCRVCRAPKLLCNHSPSSHVAFVIVGMVFAAILIVVEAVAAADQWQ